MEDDDDELVETFSDIHATCSGHTLVISMKSYRRIECFTSSKDFLLWELKGDHDRNGNKYVHSEAVSQRSLHRLSLLSSSGLGPGHFGRGNAIGPWVERT